jgi:hypothetical protein
MPIGIRNSNTIGGKKIIKKISKPKTKPKMRGGKGGYIYHNLTDFIKDGNEGKINYLIEIKEKLNKYNTEIDNCYKIIIEKESYTQEKEKINDKHNSTKKIKIFLDKLIDFLLYLLGYVGRYPATTWGDIKTLFEHKNNINKNNDNENTQINILLNAIVGGGINKQEYFKEGITTIEALKENLPKSTKETAEYIHRDYKEAKRKVVENKNNTIEELLEFFEWLLFEKYPDNYERIIIIISIIDNIHSVFLGNLTYFQEKLDEVKKREKEKEKLEEVTKREKEKLEEVTELRTKPTGTKRLRMLKELPPRTSKPDVIVNEETKQKINDITSKPDVIVNEETKQKIIDITTTILPKIYNIKVKFDNYFDTEYKNIDKLALPHYNNFIYIYDFLKGLIDFLALNFDKSANFIENFTTFYNSIKHHEYHSQIDALLIKNISIIGKKEDAAYVENANKANYLNGNIIIWLLTKYTDHNDRLDILIKVVDVIYIHFVDKCKSYVTDENVCSGGASKVVVKKILNPYNKYVAKQFPSMKKKFPNDKAPQIMQKIAIEWNKMKK